MLLILLAVSLAGYKPEPRRITLDLKDANIHNVLRLLADVGRVNLVVPDEVQGRITIRLTNVPWTEALEVILQSKGLGQEKIGEVIHVDTLERIAKRHEVEGEIRAARMGTGSLVTVIIPLRYARAAEAAPLVRGMLTERGSVQVDARTNALIVTDVEESTESVRARLSH
jgi:type II secretory pathway component HofQ